MYQNDDMKKMAEVFEGMLRKGKLQELTPMLEGIAPVAETRALQEMYHGKAKNDPKLVKKGAEARKKGELDYQFGPGDDHPHAENPWKFPEHKPGSLKNQKVAPKGKKDESTTYYAWQTLGLEERKDYAHYARAAADAKTAGDSRAAEHLGKLADRQQTGQAVGAKYAAYKQAAPRSDDRYNKEQGFMAALSAAKAKRREQNIPRASAHHDTLRPDAYMTPLQHLKTKWNMRNPKKLKPLVP